MPRSSPSPTRSIFATSGHAGSNIHHLAPNTTSNILSKSISKDGGYILVPRLGPSRTQGSRMQGQGRV